MLLATSVPFRNGKNIDYSHIFCGFILYSAWYGEAHLQSLANLPRERQLPAKLQQNFSAIFESFDCWDRSDWRVKIEPADCYRIKIAADHNSVIKNINRYPETGIGKRLCGRELLLKCPGRSISNVNIGCARVKSCTMKRRQVSSPTSSSWRFAYSLRNAISGSTFVARRAGSQHASNATPMNPTPIAT